VLGRAQGTLYAWQLTLDVIRTKGLREQQQQVVHWQSPPIDNVNNKVGVKAYVRDENNAILLPP
jgi:hypothetical protein